jgi:hypothetical protein
MTGFDSKRQMAQAKLDDNGDTQVDAAVLTIVYQRGFADGKAAQRKPLTDEELEQIFRKSSGYGGDDFQAFARAIEAAHNIGEKT